MFFYCLNIKSLNTNVWPLLSSRRYDRYYASGSIIFYLYKHKIILMLLCKNHYLENLNQQT